jgi:hypothetical protein
VYHAIEPLNTIDIYTWVYFIKQKENIKQTNKKEKKQPKIEKVLTLKG